MISKEVRHKLVYIFLGVYLVYGIVYIGMTGVLFSAAVGLISMSFNSQLEIMVAGIIISGLLWNQVVNRKREGFTGGQQGMQGPQGIVDRISKFKWNAGPQAVLSSSFAEGFSDASASASASASAPGTGAMDTPPPPNSATSTPAPTTAPASTSNLTAAIPTPPVQSGFTDKLTDGMFKLGAVPADSVGGSHIDIGTTLMNALNSMKPDQIKAMTDDTRKLMETQKDLMGMLSSVKPMLKDGKELMSTFKDMFGGMPGS